jgi:hypothetical protein
MVYLRESAAHAVAIHTEVSGSVDIVRTVDTGFADGEWHHLVVTSDGTDYYFYIDGQARTTTTEIGTNSGDWFADIAGRDNVIIGAEIHTSTLYHFGGSLSDIAVYNYPLTPDEVKAHYEAGLWTAVPPFNIAGVIYDDTGAPCQRIVRVYNRATGSLILETTSDPITGVYQVTTPAGDEVQRVVLDDSAGQIYNDIIDRILPGTN